MRDNGLTAPDYTSLGQIDPRVTAPVLTALAEAGIAAHVRTAGTGDKPERLSPPTAPEPDNSTHPADSSEGAEPAGVQPEDPDGQPRVRAEQADSADPARGPGLPEEPVRAERADGAAEDYDGDQLATPPESPLGTHPAAPAEGPKATSGDGQPNVRLEQVSQPEEHAGEPDSPVARQPVERDADAVASGRAVVAGEQEIFVDSEQVDAARPVIARSTQDAEWQSLVEQFNLPSAPGHDSPVPRWPASEDVDENSYEPLIDVPAGLDRTEDEPEPKRPAKRRDDDPHDHFIPPEPPRGPKLDWISRAAWLGLVGGPVLLIVAALFDFGTGRLTTLAVAGFAGGFLTLVLRMKDRLPQDDTPDDGAVV